MMPYALPPGSPKEIAFIDANVPPACISRSAGARQALVHGAHCISPESPEGSLDSDATSGNGDPQNPHRSAAVTHLVFND
jgi:hypothetical protein